MIDMNNITNVFVYGTLMRGLANHELLASAECIDGDVWTQPQFRMYDLGWFPGITFRYPGRAIRGELYRVDDATRARLDRLEGVPTFYWRTSLELDDGRPAVVYALTHAYVTHHRPREIDTGDWRTYTRCITIPQTGAK